MPQRGCSAVSQRLRWRAPLTEAIWSLGMPTIRTALLRDSSLSHLRLSVQRNSQTDWLVRRALWLYYIVNFGTALTLTVFPWLVEPQNIHLLYLHNFRLQSGEPDTPSGHLSIFVSWKGYCKGNIHPHLHPSLKYIFLQSDFYLILLHNFTASHFFSFKHVKDYKLCTPHW